MPFLEFVKSNYYLMTKSLLLNVSTYFFIIFFFYSIFYYVLKKTIPLDQNRIKYVLSFSVFFWVLFHFNSIQNFLYLISSSNKYSKNLTAEISLIIIILFSLSFMFNNCQIYFKISSYIFYCSTFYNIFRFIKKFCIR